MNCSRPTPALHVLQRETQIFQPTSSKEELAKISLRSILMLTVMQLLKEKLPQGQKSLDAAFKNWDPKTGA